MDALADKVHKQKVPYVHSDMHMMATLFNNHIAVAHGHQLALFLLALNLLDFFLEIFLWSDIDIEPGFWAYAWPQNNSCQLRHIDCPLSAKKILCKGLRQLFLDSL